MEMNRSLKKYMLTPGERVEVHIPAGSQAGDYLSAVLKVTKEGVVMDLPGAADVQAVPSQGQDVIISYNRPGDATYRFSSKVVFTQKKPVPLMYVALPHEIDRRQMREFVRVDCAIPVQIMRTSEADEGEHETYTGVITNISGGGMTVATTMETTEQEFLRFRFSLPEREEEVTFTGLGGKVLVIKPPKPPYPEKQLAVEFQGIGDSDQDEIVRYCLDTQMHLRRQGKL